MEDYINIFEHPHPLWQSGLGPGLSEASATALCEVSDNRGATGYRNAVYQAEFVPSGQLLYAFIADLTGRAGDEHTHTERL
jgi:hypothetical protein